ncbi:Nose resistant to fluoxetine protein 6 [Papilio xuthus]|uniref:Nose resistant to fluoxetine protein 6 n=1 Tax=Papilio xuthus TaxID=66420 RepID=A0A194PQV6_PAPXU|nr:Nose resistant to fluoxetine protein 6 [Papilio xuthus]
MTTERQLASCKRCGKYRKQNEPPKHMATLPTCPRQYKTCASLTNTEYRKRDSLFLNLLLSFSLKHNCKRIFNTTMANQDLAVVHLLRIFSTFWIIFIHVCMLVSYLTENTNSNGWMGSYPILTTGTLAFDTLIFASGIFSAHHFFYLSSRYTLRELVSCGGNCGKLFQFVCFVTNRAVRLLPPYAYTIFLTAVLSRVSRDTQPVTFPEQDHNCDVNWWRNLLYITLFYPQEKQCMQICWYLSTETSLHACGALLCAVLVRRRRSALLLLNLVLLAAVGSDVFTAFADYHRRRLLPPYAYTIFLTAVLSRVSRDTQPVTFPGTGSQLRCELVEKLVCMQICWYLSTETSLHACGALLCAVLVRRRRSALLLLNLVLLAAVGSDVFTAFADYHRRYSNVFEAYYYIINRPLSRAAPYLVGVLAGWMIHKADGRISVSRMTRCCLWGASVSAAVTSAVTSESVRHWACAWLHVTWPLALLWPALVCSTDHAAWSRVVVSCGGVAALSRLSYSALLVHGAAARWLVLRAAPALCTHTACIWSYFAGTLMVSVAGALVLALLLELPACCLLRRICDYAYS